MHRFSASQGSVAIALVVGLSILAGAGLFFARPLVGSSIALVFDDEVYSAPIIQTYILGGATQTTGNFTKEEAEAFTFVLNSEHLPLGLNVLEKSESSAITLDKLFYRYKG